MSKLIFDEVIDATLSDSILELNNKVPDSSFFNNRLSKQAYQQNYLWACKTNETIIAERGYTLKNLLMMKEQWLHDFIIAGRQKYIETSRLYPLVAIVINMVALTLNRNAWGFLVLSIIMTILINLRSVFSSRKVPKLSPRAILLLNILDYSIIKRQPINEDAKTKTLNNNSINYRNYLNKDKRFISLRVDKLFIKDLTRPFNHLFHLNTYVKEQIDIELIRDNHILLSQNMDTIIDNYAKHLDLNNIDPDDITQELKQVSHINDVIKSSKTHVIPSIMFIGIYEWAVFLINFAPNFINALIFIALNFNFTMIITNIVHKPVSLIKNNNYVLLNTIHSAYQERRYNQHHATPHES